MSAESDFVPAPRPLKPRPIGLTLALIVFAAWIAFLFVVYARGG